MKSSEIFCEFLNTSTYSILLPSFIVIYLEIAKLRERGQPVFLFRLKAQSK